MGRPLIGVMPLFDDEKDSLWMIPGYFEGIELAGGVPVMLPLDLDRKGFEEVRDRFDGFLFTGGHDVDPAMYGEKPVPQDEPFCLKRDRLEQMIFSWCYKQDVPALGICRGIQIFNVVLGGDLWQDIPSQKSSGQEPEKRVCHSMEPPYELHHAEHEVTVAPDSPLWEMLRETGFEKPDRILVNSYHHQGLRKTGEGLKPMAWADDGLTEAVYAPHRHFIWGVQWHPEFTLHRDGFSQEIFRTFVKATET